MITEKVKEVKEVIQTFNSLKSTAGTLGSDFISLKSILGPAPAAALGTPAILAVSERRQVAGLLSLVSRALKPGHVRTIVIDDDTLLRGTVDGAVVDTVDDVVGILPVHGAADGLGGAENLEITIKICMVIRIKI